jgi:hypothetical protein
MEWVNVWGFYKIHSGSYPEQRKEMEIEYPTLNPQFLILAKKPYLLRILRFATKSCCYMNIQHNPNHDPEYNYRSQNKQSYKLVSRVAKHPEFIQLQPQACNKHQWKRQEKYALPDKYCSGHTME